MKVLMVVGSCRKNSYNQIVADYIMKNYGDKVSFRQADLSALPIYCEDIEEIIIPSVTKLREDVKVFEREGTSGIDENNMFYIMYKTEFSAEELDRGLKKTGLEGMGKHFKEAEKNTGINAIFLAALANHESNYGNSNIAKKKNNLFGFNAYDESPMESASDYNNYGDSIKKVSSKIKDLYLKENGRYFKGYSTEAINIHYSTDKTWAKKVNRHMIRFAHKILQNS